MHRQLPSQFPLTNVNRQTHPPTSDTSSPSPPSSRTTSPSSSPTSTSTFRNHQHHRQLSHATPHHLFNLSFHPHQHQHQHQNLTSNPKRETSPQQPESSDHPQSTNPLDRNQSPQYGVSILPCAVLRGRSSLMVLRRRPSAVDMALSEERSRCDGDAIERQGLGLMEPRPVDMNLTMNGSGSMRRGPRSSSLASAGGDGDGSVQQEPRFVMGGIFEVMEGRA